LRATHVISGNLLLKSGTLRGADLPNPAPGKVVFVQKHNLLNQPLGGKANHLSAPLGLNTHLPCARFSPFQSPKMLLSGAALGLPDPHIEPHHGTVNIDSIV
jgi:hypothetical protein